MSIKKKKVMVKNAASERQVSEAAFKEKIGKDKELDEIRCVLSTPQGKRFVWRYLEKCGVFKTSFTGSSETFFLEGRRDIGLALLAEVCESSPEAYLEMLKANGGIK